MKNKIINILLGIVFFFIATIFLIKILGIQIYFIICLFVSSIAIFFLSKIRNIIGTYLIIAVVGFNIVLLIFSLVPVYSKDVDVSGFYKQQQNMLKIDLKDSKELIDQNMAKVIIRNPNFANKEINLTDTNPNIVINSGDTIMFISKTKKIETIVSLYLWDGSIIRLLPQSSIRVNKLLKDNEDLLGSKTEVEVTKGDIWFRVIRTIFNNDGFNIKTDNGTIVIRGTAGMVSDQNGNAVVYSEDHIIEIKDNLDNTYMIGKGESAQMQSNGIFKLDTQQLINAIGEEVYKKFDYFNNLDLSDIQNYKDEIISYVKSNFDRSLDNSNFLKQLSEFKLNLLTKIDPSGYMDNTINYEKFKYLIGSDGNIENLAQYTENIKDLVITPTQNATDFINIKLEFLKNIASGNNGAMESFVINTYNKVLDEGVNVNIDQNLIKQNIENISNSSSKVIENLYNQIKMK